MHIPTHVLSGWCVANLLPVGPRERLLCMVAATIPDLDGLGILVSPRWYARYHHVLGHNGTLAVITAVVLGLLARRHRIVTGLACLGLFHLHLLMDYYGSGPGWAISYWWPWHHGPGYWWINPDPWEFSSWQNQVAAGAMILWTVAIGWWCRRTPLEAIMPNLDRQLVRRGASARGRGFAEVVPAGAEETR